MVEQLDDAEVAWLAGDDLETRLASRTKARRGCSLAGT